LVKNNEVFALQSIVVAATVLGVSVFSVSEFEYMLNENVFSFVLGVRGSGANGLSLFKP
jgi:hypothetical protein